MTGMLAIQKLSPGYGQVAAALVDRPAPPEGDEVRLRVEAAGICGTDLLIYKWGAFAQRMRPPTILGHEVSGIVLETGPAVRRLRPGMRVSVESHLPMCARIRSIPALISMAGSLPRCCCRSVCSGRCRRTCRPRRRR